jgi:hypothetical protein
MFVSVGRSSPALYELVTASLKATDTLATACPADTALTPVGYMETKDNNRIVSQGLGAWLGAAAAVPKGLLPTALVATTVLVAVLMTETLLMASCLAWVAPLHNPCGSQIVLTL